MKKEKSYIYQSLVILIMASGFFLFFKAKLPNKILSSEPIVNKNVVIDSLLLQAVADYNQDSLSSEKTQKDKPDLKDVSKSKTDLAQSGTKDTLKAKQLYLSDGDFKEQSSFDSTNWAYLEEFFSNLYDLENAQGKRVRIAYYGDSMTDGDMIVQDFRGKYQKKYGGFGVGFIPINVESSRSRGSVIHRYSNNWTTQSYVNTKKPARGFGVSGGVFFVKDSTGSADLTLQAGGLATMKTLHSPTLYYAQSDNKNGLVQVIVNKDTISKKLNAQKNVNKLTLYNAEVSKIKLNFVDSDSIGFYGVDVSSATGVQVDNYSSRGNSGLPISLFKPSIMQGFNQDFNYSLIILHFGTNVLNYGSYNYSWYTKQMGRVVEHLKQCFPGASILVVSTADKSTKYDTAMQSDSAVVPLVKAQRKYALDKQVGFFNLYSAMGGQGSMVKWVEELPTRANKDYTHFNYNGAKQVASLMFDQIDKAYLVYKQKRDAAKSKSSPVDSLEKQTQTNNTSELVDTLNHVKR